MLRHMEDVPMELDNRIVGEQNTLSLLTYLHRFGWLTSRMLAALVWPTAKQSMAMSRRALKALGEKKLVLRRALPGGGDCYTLSAAGARFLNDASGLSAQSGASLALGNIIHRACANWYAIQQIHAGFAVWTEHEIQSDRAPVTNVAGKVPDGLVETPYGLLWLEVENAWKNRSERGKVVRFCATNLPASGNLTELSPGYYLFRVVVIGTNVDAIQAIVRSFSDAYASKELSESQASDIELGFLPVDKSLAPGEFVSGSLLYDALSPT